MRTLYLPTGIRPVNLNRARAVLRDLPGLSDREQAVVRLVAQGKTDAEVAEALEISVASASMHLYSIRRKLGPVTRVELALMAWGLREP